MAAVLWAAARAESTAALSDASPGSASLARSFRKTLVRSAAAMPNTASVTRCLDFMCPAPVGGWRDPDVESPKLSGPYQRWLNAAR